MLLCAANKLHRSRFSRNFTVLAFESSADDTCAAIVNSERKIISNVVVRQTRESVSTLGHRLVNTHSICRLAENGGIHPSAAIEAHQRNLPRAVRRALNESRLNVMTDIDGIAFTRGPGIGGCLSVSSNAAKTLAAALNKPLVGVHHMVSSPADFFTDLMYLASTCTYTPFDYRSLFSTDLPLPHFAHLRRTHYSRSRSVASRF